MKPFPVFCRHHFNCVPRTTVQESAVRTFADALLTADAEIRIDFNAAEWWMVFIRHPEHTGLDGTILDTSGRSGTSGTTVRRDGKDAWFLLARGLSVALRHRPMFLYNVVQTFVPWC